MFLFGTGKAKFGPSQLDQLLGLLGGTGVNAFTTYDETVYHNTFPASQVGPWLEVYAHRFEDPVFRLFPSELEAVYEEKNIALDTTGDGTVDKVVPIEQQAEYS